MPPLNDCGLSLARSARPTSASAASTRSRSSAPREAVERAEQLEVGGRAEVLVDRELLRHDADAALGVVRVLVERPAASRPSPMKTSPRSAPTRPHSIATVVDLPAPFGPSRPTISPAPTASDRSATTARPPYDLQRPWASSIGSPSGTSATLASRRAGAQRAKRPIDSGAAPTAGRRRERRERETMRTVTTGEFEGGSVFIDGDWKPLSEAKISLFDWGFTRSDATYDVASVWHGAFFRLDDHLDRFFASLAKMRMSIPYTRAEVRAILHGCVQAGGLRDAYVAMVCTRGVPPRGSRDPRLATNRFYAYALPFVWIAPPEKQTAGIDLHVSQRLRIAPESVDPTIKNYHWLDLVLSLFDAYDRGADTSCVVDARGNVAEGPGFNVFVVQRRRRSHARARRPRRRLAAHRDRAVRRARAFRCASRRVPAADLAGADEVFLSSTGGGVLPIARVDGRPLAGAFPGPITRRLQEAYWALHDEARHRDPIAY